MSTHLAEVPVRSRAVTPFAIAGLVGLGTFAVPPYGERTTSIVAAGVVVVLLVAWARWAPWARWPRWAQDSVPIGFFAVVALVRDGSGGSLSGAGQLVVIPALWVALHGSRRGLAAACVATAAIFVVPSLFGDPAAYPTSDWLRATILVAAIAAVGPAIQAVVRGLSQRDTALTRLNDELQAAEEQWRLFADQLPDTIVLVADADLRYQVVGGAGVLREGVSGWVGRTLFETSGPDNVAALEPIYRRALAGQAGVTQLVATSSRLPHEVTVVPFDHHGRASIMIVARDVSQAQQREAELNLATLHVRQLIDEAPTGICEVRVDGSIVQANAQLTSMLGIDDVADLTAFEVGLLPPELDLAEIVRAGELGRVSLEQRLPGVAGEPAAHLMLNLVPITSHQPASSDGGHDTIDQTGVVLVHAYDVTAQRRLEARLRHMATHDPLTGLVNRRRFDELLARHLTECARYGPRGAVVMLDLDHFKAVNDTLGHHAGDTVITTVATTLVEVLRDSDTVARLGGDEFAILLPRGGLVEAGRVAERVLSAVRTRIADLDHEATRAVTVSLGIALVAAESGADQLLTEADAQLYRAKAAGRDQYAVGGPSND